jgi:putative DNA primase/helicase
MDFHDRPGRDRCGQSSRRTGPRTSRLKFENVKAAARGRWPEILPALGITGQLIKRSSRCPGCGGKDRFSFDDKNGDGTWICHQGGAGIAAGDGFDLLCHVGLARGKGAALRQVAGYLGLEAVEQRRPKGKLVATYEYCDPISGTVSYRKMRFEAPDGSKATPFVPRRIGEPLLYNGQRLAEHPLTEPVFIVEGEKCCDALTRLGALALSGDTGADSRWTDDHARLLQGRRIVLWPDNDVAGERYAANAVAAIRALDPRAQLHVIRIPDLPEGGDCADWVSAGGTAEQLVRLAREAQTYRAVDLAPDAEPPYCMPRGFYMTPVGVFARSENGERPDLTVCGPLEVLARTRDITGGDSGKLLRWRDGDGRTREWVMSNALLAGDGAQLRVHLLLGELWVGASRRQREWLLAYLLDARPEARIHIASRLGWHDTPDGWVFVLPLETITTSSVSEAVRLSVARPELLPPIAAAGTLDEWRVHVAAPCVGNSRLVLAVSMGFAGPLIRLIKAESGGVHLRGPSSEGKTACLITAGSVWGGGQRGWLQGWRATDNGLEDVAMAHSDTLLTLDEIGELSPRTVGAAAYMLANGSGKRRAGRDGSAKEVASWHLLFLSSGEVSLEQRAADTERPGRLQAGVAVRVLDLVADAGAGLGCFEALHDETEAAAFANRIMNAASRMYGTAGPAFLRAIAANLPAAIGSVDRLRQEFIAGCVPDGAHGQVVRVAGRFAIIAAAGELARMLKVVPWPEGEATHAATRCFNDWLGARGGTGPRESMDALAQVRGFIEAHGESRFTLILPRDSCNQERLATDRTTTNRVGFRRQIEGGWEFMVLPEAWRNEVCRGRDPKQVVQALLERGLLLGAKAEHPADSVRIPGYSRLRLYRVSGNILGGDNNV